MTLQPHRLTLDKPHALGGSAINRQRPLQFRLNGRTIHGFEGDTVLSAVLAAGIDSVGLYRGQLLALSERYAPSVVAAGAHDPARQALPMARIPAMDGADLVTLGSQPQRGRLAGLADLFGRTSRTLGINLDHFLLQPWLDAAAQSGPISDVIVVGGGVAGMTAAIAAARLGRSVCLIERNSYLGGAAVLFGSMEGEETPAESVARLKRELAALPNIVVLLRSDAISVHPGRVIVHIVDSGDSLPSGRMEMLTAGAIVLASGTLERLPVFPGNRLPGVNGSLAALERARNYGVWAGQSAVFSTVAGAPYRVAMQASDAGITVLRIADARPNPQSRFIEFTKAYGIRRASGMAPVGAAVATGGKHGLSISLDLAFDGYHQKEAPMIADQFVVCGGWQPDLSLWLTAGGKIAWDSATQRLQAELGPAGVALAGSAAGWISKQACMSSGADAINFSFGRKRKPIVERQIDAVYDTLDGHTPVPGTSTAITGKAPAFLDNGERLNAIPDATGRTWWFMRKPTAWSLSQLPQAFSVCDIAAGVQMGAIAAQDAGEIAAERCPSSSDLVHLPPMPIEKEQGDAPPALIPDYLRGRFGAQPQVWRIETSEVRTIDRGALIFVNSDQSDPRQAIGVVLLSDPAQVLALIGRSDAKSGDGVTVRDEMRPLSARLLERHEVGA